MRRPSLITIFLLLISLSAASQQQDESKIIRLISANSAEIIQSEGRNLKKVSGNVQFLHNNTYILCDTAIWDVFSNILDAKGNVKVIQKNTKLTGDIIHYMAYNNLAEFRGSIVEMIDKDNNRLRTMYMTYHTKDSVATFNYGGSILDKDSNAIESYSGIYDAKKRAYLFSQNVEIKNDSLVVVSDSVMYLPAEEKIYFRGASKAWKGSDFIKFNGGIYDRKKQAYQFSNNVYMNTPDQEIWADSVSYKRTIANGELFGNVQIADTSRDAIFFGDYGRYLGNPQSALMTKRPSVAYYTMEKGVADTLFIKGDTLRFNSLEYSQIDSVEKAVASQRAKLANEDGFKSLLKTMESSKPKGGGSSSDRMPKNLPPSDAHKISAKGKMAPPAKRDSIPPVQKDTLPPVKRDSIMTDSLSKAIPKTNQKIIPDTTKIKYINVYHNVRIFKNDLQGVCDSIIFSSLDSLARLYKSPLLWNENNQFSADSIQILIKNKAVNKAELMTGAFTVSKSDSLHYNQIKAANIVGYFTDGELTRFDALGNVSLIFFVEETVNGKKALTTMNTKECRAMRVLLDKGSIQTSKYVQDVKDNAYPLADLEISKQKLKGFNWSEDLRPKNRYEVCDRMFRISERESSLKIPLPYFNNTNRFFQFKTRYSPDIKR